MNLTGKPWDVSQDEVPAEVHVPRGMVGPEERRCFYWLAKYGLMGKGAIVDAGSFVGASTFCLASGAVAGGNLLNGTPTVHAYDFFQANDAYVVEWIKKNFRPIEKGGSYLDIFQQQMAKYIDIVEAHPGDFAGQKWNGGNIQLLFVDVAKKPQLNAHLIGEFFPNLVPGESILIHQDYYHCWHPYIHYSIEYFGDAFEVIDELVLHQSRVWRLVKPLPEEKIARLSTGGLDERERMALLNRVVERASPECLPMMEVTRLWQRCLDKDYAGTKTAFEALDEKYGYQKRYEIWAKQALAVNRYCEKKIDERHR